MNIDKLKVEYTCRNCGKGFTATHYNVNFDLMLVNERLEGRTCTECLKYTMAAAHIECTPKEGLLEQLGKIDGSLKPYSIIYQCVRCYHKWTVPMHLKQSELSIYDIPDPPRSSRNIGCTSNSCTSKFSRVVEVIPLHNL